MRSPRKGGMSYTVPPTGQRGQISPRAMVILDRAGAAYNARLETIFKEAHAIADPHVSGRDASVDNARHFQRVEELKEREDRLFDITKDCFVGLGRDPLLLKGQRERDTDVLALMLLSRYSRAQALTKLGFIHLGPRERDPLMAAEYFFESLQEDPFDKRTFAGFLAACSQCGVLVTMAGLPERVHDFYSIIAGSLKLGALQRLPWTLTEGIWPFEIQFDERMKNTMGKKKVRDTLPKAKHLFLEFFAETLHAFMTGLFVKEYGLVEEPLRRGDVIVDTNIIITFLDAQKGGRLTRKERAAVDFVDYVLKNGGRLFVTTPELYEIRYIPDSLKSSIRLVKLSEIEAKNIKTKDGRRYSTRDAILAMERYGYTIQMLLQLGARALRNL